MAIVSVTADLTRMQMHQRGEIGRNKTIKRWWWVKTDSSSVGPDAVAAASGLPALGDTYSYGSESDANARVREIFPRRNARKPRLWEVEVTYVSDEITAGGSGDASELTAALPSIRVYSVQYEESYDEDVDGLAVENTAGEPFDPPLRRDATRMAVEVEQYQLLYDAGAAYDYVNTINSDVWWGLPPRTWKMQSIGGTNLSWNGVHLYRVRYELHMSTKGWDAEPLNQGLYKLVDGDRQRITDGVGLPIEKMTNLDNSGEPLPKGADPIRLTFRPYEEKNFGGLPLPTSLNLS